jgi:hypothetical protein
VEIDAMTTYEEAKEFIEQRNSKRNINLITEFKQKNGGGRESKSEEAKQMERFRNRKGSGSFSLFTIILNFCFRSGVQVPTNSQRCRSPREKDHFA